MDYISYKKTVKSYNMEHINYIIIIENLMLQIIEGMKY